MKNEWVVLLSDEEFVSYINGEKLGYIKIPKSFIKQMKEEFRNDIIKGLRLKELSTPKNKYQLYYSRLYKYFKELW